MTVSGNSAQQPAPAANRSWGERFRSGGWYYVVVLASAGILSCIPFWHAWTRLRTRALLVMAIFYTAVAVVLVYVLPTSSERTDAGGSASNVTGPIAVVLMVSACVLLVRPRREVFGLARTTASPDDLAIQRARDGRARRDKARNLAQSEPQVARQLRIGRPDLPRDYDDGGLVDVNSAPVSVIADVCGIDEHWAAQIVDARERRGGAYVHAKQIFVDVPGLPRPVLDRIEDRAVCVG